MKTILPVVLLIIIAILGCTLGYEIVHKNRIEKETDKGWHQYEITRAVQYYKDLDHGDVDKVKVHLMLGAKLEAEVYVKAYGREKGTEFSTNLSEANEIYDTYQATNRSTN
jgi:hypothetical protein